MQSGLLLLRVMSNEHLVYHNAMAVLVYQSLAAVLLRLFSVILALYFTFLPSFRISFL